MAQSIVSREELLENAYRIAEKSGVSELSVRGLANATGVSAGTVYRHFSAKDELTTATIQLYFKHAFYERFCHIDPQVGFVDYCWEMHASMRGVTTHFRECWLRGIDALPAVEKAAAASIRSVSACGWCGCPVLRRHAHRHPRVPRFRPHRPCRSCWRGSRPGLGAAALLEALPRVGGWVCAESPGMGSMLKSCELSSKPPVTKAAVRSACANSALVGRRLFVVKKRSRAL